MYDTWYSEHYKHKHFKTFFENKLCYSLKYNNILA